MSGEKSATRRKRFAAIRPDFGGQEAVCAVLSGLLLTATFRPFAMAWIAWIALIPLAWAVCRSTRWGGVQLALTAGMVHWVSAVWWVGKVTAAGMFALAMYCALYFILPLLFWRAWNRRMGWNGWRGVGGLSVVSSAWCGAEMLRSKPR